MHSKTAEQPFADRSNAFRTGRNVRGGKTTIITTACCNGNTIFLRHKFGLSPMEDFVFKNLRTRPVNFPYLKVAQLAALWVRYDTLFSAILEARSTGEIKKYFRIPPSGYWETHYHSGMLLPKGKDHRRKRPEHPTDKHGRSDALCLRPT